jgi:hypothetical protein
MLPNLYATEQCGGLPTMGGDAMSDAIGHVPFTQTPGYRVDRIKREGYIQFRSALLCAGMAEAAYAFDLPTMLSSTLALREFIVERFNPHFECDSAEVLEEIDAHVARLRGLIAGQRVVS